MAPTSISGARGLPHVPDALPDLTKTKQGYESKFTPYCYQYQPLRKLQRSWADRRRLEPKTPGLLKQVSA